MVFFWTQVFLGFYFSFFGFERERKRRDGNQSGFFRVFFLGVEWRFFWVFLFFLGFGYLMGVFNGFFWGFFIFLRGVLGNLFGGFWRFFWGFVGVLGRGVFGNSFYLKGRQREGGDVMSEIHIPPT